MCIAAFLVDAGHGEKRPFDGDQAGDDLDGLRSPLVGVRPADLGGRESGQEIV